MALRALLKKWTLLLVASLLVLSLGIAVVPPRERGLAWGSVRDDVADYNTHGNIDAVAYWALFTELDLLELENPFPNVARIVDEDFLALSGASVDFTRSTSPDLKGPDGPTTRESWHYDNAPLASQTYYEWLVQAIRGRAAEERAAHYAAWMAHFASDPFVPWHTEGFRYTGQTAEYLDSGYYEDDPEAFLVAVAASPNGNLDYYDPSYWDGRISTNLTSTHITWERHVDHPIQAAPGFDPLWVNTPGIPGRVSAFIEKVRARTSGDFYPLRSDPNRAVSEAVRGVYTLWRSAISAFKLDLFLEETYNPQLIRLKARVRNLDKLYDGAGVQVKIDLPAGMALSGPGAQVQIVGGDGALEKKTLSEPVTWEISGDPTAAGECPAATVWVSGNLSGAPDLASPAGNFGQVGKKIYLPPQIRIIGPADRSTISDTKVDVEGQFSDPNVRSWIEVNGSDKIWISADYNSGSTFKKRVELRAGHNQIVVYAVNRCGAGRKAVLELTGDFVEPEIKVVMSWDHGDSDVDLHLTDSNGGPECYYGNKTPNWGDPNSTEDDPQLDIDNVQGYGPETIIIRNPEPGRYTVRVVYYSDHEPEKQVATLVTVKVYVDGLLQGEFYHKLNDTGDAWEGVYTFTVGSVWPQAPASGLRLGPPGVDSPAAPLAGVESRLSADPAVQFKPAIAGNRAVWVDRRHGNHSQVYVYDLAASGESRASGVDLSGQLQDPPLSSVLLQDSPALDGGWVVWVDNRLGGAVVYGKEFATGTESQRVKLPGFAGGRLAFSGDRLVWEDRRNTPEGGGSADIFVYNFASQIETRLTPEGASGRAPDISGSRVVWADNRRGMWLVYLYDLSTATETQVSRFGTANPTLPRIDGETIVWADGRNGNSDIFLYNIATQEEIQITSDPSEQTAPDISGGRIVWVDHRNGNADIYSYDLLTGWEASICTNPAEQREPSIEGNHIVWTDDRDGNPNIYLFTVQVEPERRTTYLPLLTKALTSGDPPGIGGLVRAYGSPALNLSLELQRLANSNWWTQATTRTGADGRYLFTNLPTLEAGSAYVTRFKNETNPAYLYAWSGNRVGAYTPGSAAAGGDFDVQDVPLVSPSPGSILQLPVTFCWTPRGLAGDNYRLAFYNPARNETAYTSYLGPVGCIQVTSMPSDWAPGSVFRWYVLVYSGSNPDATPLNYGISYQEREVRLSWPSYQYSTQTDWLVQPGSER